jgi:DNA-binding CsgD family transcriptional regulator
LLFSSEGPLPRVPYTRSLERGFEKYVREDWIHHDFRFSVAPPIYMRRGVATELDFITPDEIARHPYYQEFLATLGLRWFAGVKVASGDDVWVLALQRSIAQGPFSPEEQQRLVALSVRLSSAAALARALGFVGIEAALSAFEVTGSAVVLINRRGEVLRANAAAEQMLAADPRISRRRLVSSSHDATAALDRALHALLWSGDRAAALPPVVLPRPGKQPVLAHAMRLTAVTADALAACQAIVVLVDPAQRPRPPEDVLRAAFGLTCAEAKVARSIGEGRTVDAVSGALGLSRETVRNQLKSVLGKTGVRRQAELVALLARLLNGPPTS